MVISARLTDMTWWFGSNCVLTRRRKLPFDWLKKNDISRNYKESELGLKKTTLSMK